MPEFDSSLDASQLSFDGINYHTRFKDLLNSIYICYKLMIEDNKKVPNNENEIRDILVDYYLKIKITNYTFDKEKPNGLGRVDIYIRKTFEEEKPHFIIECKRLDKTKGQDGLSGKYISNGIHRFLREHYYLSNNFNTNAMIGFVVEKLDISLCIAELNNLSKQYFKNTIEIKKYIIPIDDTLYISSYQTGKSEKDFFIYHLMMDFSDNLK
jgi:hypothetical protein